MIKHKIAFYAFIGLLMSSVLFVQALPVFVMLLVVVWFWEGQFSKKWSLLKSNKTLAFLPLLFVFFTIGLRYSENQVYGLEKMETRLSLFVLPVILPSMISLNFAYNRRVFSKWYVRAAVFTALFCVSRAVVFFLYNKLAFPSGASGFASYLLHDTLSKGFMNPEYLAMYSNTALLFCLYDLRINQSLRTKYRRIFQALVLILFVVLLNATAGFVALLAILVAFAMRWAWFQRKWYYSALTFVVVSTLVVLLYTALPSVRMRVNTITAGYQSEKLDPLSTESLQTRVHAWQAAQLLIAEKPAFGHGTGDAMDALYIKYEELGFLGARSQETNAHNEFFQTGIALGFLGISVLIALFTSALYIAFRRRNFALGVWTLCLALAMTFESYLNTQAGVVLLALFMSFITLFNCDDRRV
jgi:O-antigen ligase